MIKYNALLGGFFILRLEDVHSKIQLLGVDGIGARMNGECTYRSASHGINDKMNRSGMFGYNAQSLGRGYPIDAHGRKVLACYLRDGLNLASFWC